jgi:ADP-ribose pyrophosphatase YjhB (NUDIX family)
MKKKNVNLKEGDINTHVVAVFGIVQKGDRFLIAKRASDDPQAGGDWSTPGGKVEADLGNEIIENNLKKEISEEVGLEINDRVVYLGSEGFIRVSGHHVVGLTFLCRWRSGVAKPLEDQEEIKWLTINELKKLKLPDYLKSRIKLLEDYLGGR